MKVRRQNWDNFPTKTVPDGVHDGEDEVEAVADVKGDQDVVEAVPHFSPKYWIIEYLNIPFSGEINKVLKMVYKA